MHTMILYHKYLNFHKIGEMQQKWNLSNMRNIGRDQELFPSCLSNAVRNYAQLADEQSNVLLPLFPTQYNSSIQ